jgi:BirA family biotin operon repressor/biotin-[acetyl-CoA-carboxylase] ligase
MTTANLSQLVAILNDGEYHDIMTISQSLNSNCDAVVNAVKKLENYGINIFSVENKSYKLLEPLTLLDKHYFSQNTQQHLCPIDIFDSLHSTNDYLKYYYNSSQPRICFAEQQTCGKGRLQRNWYSPFGQNIYFSYLHLFKKDIRALAGLSLVISLAVVKTLQNYHLLNPLQVKWPNDIIYQNRKLAGCLTEIQVNADSVCSVIIGIGININMIAANVQQISQPWTSMRNILNTYVDRNPLCVLLINNVITYINQFENKGLLYFVEEWQEVDAMFDKEVTLNCANRKIQGMAKGINEFGCLQLTLPNGEIKAFSSGEATFSNTV